MQKICGEKCYEEISTELSVLRGKTLSYKVVAKKMFRKIL